MRVVHDEGVSWSSGLNTWSSSASGEEKGQGVHNATQTKTEIKLSYFEVLLTSFTMNSPWKISIMCLYSWTVTEKTKTLHFDTCGNILRLSVLGRGNWSFFLATLCWQKPYLQSSVHQKERNAPARVFIFREKEIDTHTKPRLSLYPSPWLVTCPDWYIFVNVTMSPLL